MLDFSEGKRIQYLFYICNMPIEKIGFIYIVTNKSNSSLYTGVTSDLESRIYEHKSGKGSKYTGKYKCTKLIYFEQFPDIVSAIDRDKQLKNWNRQWKIELIEKTNPDFLDLAQGWYDDFKE